MCKFKNGTYKINNDVYKISECSNQYVGLQNMEIKEVEYNDMVYCVELEKFHTLLTKRNGKVIWNGNCRHSITIYVKDFQPEDKLQEDIDFTNSDEILKKHVRPEGTYSDEG
jgi:hypothetical protein